MIFKKLYYTIFFVFVCQWTQAQLPSVFSTTLRHKKISTFSLYCTIDSFSIVPQSFIIPLVPSENYKLDAINATLRWVKQPIMDSVEVIYRIFPTRLNEKKYKQDYERVRNNFLSEVPINVAFNQHSSNSILDFNQVQANGIIGRAFSFGNNQDAVLNSTLNLQLHGFLADSMELTATISDNNLPIQPEGNTKDLRDFDRILIQVKKKEWQLNMGDLDISEDNNYFLNFKKRIQGVVLDQQFEHHQLKDKVIFSGAIAKGKFANNKIAPIEGNQGPYRLQGVNNELYFVVLAGTERVYLDGELLVRGEDQDYTINYNTAEIIFTPKRLITKDKRIQVDFEYANRNYLNTQLFFKNELQLNDKVSIAVSAFINKDNKSSTIDQPLDEGQLQLLASIGDSLQNAFVLNAVTDTFSVGKLLYKKIDTIFNGNIHDSVFVYCPVNTPNLYNVSFRYVGQGNGDYKQLLSGTNGRVYQWLAPVNNIKQGDFVPGNFIPTPKLQEIFTSSFKLNLFPHFSILSEGGMSYNDVNLFSTLDVANKSGWAAKISIFDTINHIKLFSKEHQLTTFFSTELIQAAYRPIERLRNVEFIRDWNLNVDNVESEEKLTNFSCLLKGVKNNFLKSETKYLKRGAEYEGWKQILLWEFKQSNWLLNTSLNNLSFKTQANSGSFFRPSILLNKELLAVYKVQVGLSYVGEFNKVKSSLLDTLIAQSFAFRKIEAFVKSSPIKQNNWEFRYFNFINWYPGKINFIKSDESNNYFIATAFLKNESSRCKLNVGYRNYKVYQQFFSNQNQDQTLLGRVEYGFNKWKNFVNGNLFYEIGSGQEQRKEFTFIQVPVGQGNYCWIDYNNNGVEELNEFELAIYQDQKKYIKIYSPSNVFVKTNFINFNYDVDIKFAQLFTHPHCLGAKILSKIGYTSSLQMEQKQQASNHEVVNPFKYSLSDANLLLNNTSFLQNIFFNQTSTKWGIDYNQATSTTKSLVTYGFEQRYTQTQSIKIRYRFYKNYQLNLLLKQAENDLATTGVHFENRNYRIGQRGVNAYLLYTFQSKFRTTLGYEFIEKKNHIDSMDYCKFNNLIVEMKYNLLSSASIAAKLSYNNISFSSYNGADRTTVGFIMLDGLSAGRNYLINLDFTKRLGSRFEWSLQYEGRTNYASHFIHIGRTSIRAIF